MKIGHYAATTATVLVLGIGAASADLLPERVSGYEYFPGIPCTIEGHAATCDVQFAGWTGSGGQVANGWRPFPGNGHGMWTAIIDYRGKPKFGGQIALLDGNFDLMFTDGKSVRGRVTGGTITWPARGQSTICGKEVAVVSMNVRYRVGATGTGLFRGCLHDLPTGSVIPPKIWGRLQ
ncbi:MAG TPA: hypothetical protein VFK79_13030 [Xanthobacteraceae bacterium]|nr:hypothetical protein [Xanthobacteraceae bacterium]